MKEDGDHPRGPISGHNVSRTGAEAKESVGAEEVAAEGDKVKKDPGYSRSKDATGVPDRGAGSDRQY